MQISNDPASYAAGSVIAADFVELTTVAVAKCGPEITANKTCHVSNDLSGSPYAEHLASFTAAVKIVDAGATVCLVGYTSVKTLPLIGDVTQFVSNGQGFAVSEVCTKKDRELIMKWDADVMKNATRSEKVKAYWMDSECGDPVTAKDATPCTCSCWPVPMCSCCK